MTLQTDTAWQSDDVPTKGKRKRDRDFKRKLHSDKPWLAIDGEGMTIAGNHLYVEFACKAQTDTVYHTITDNAGLTGWRIFNLLCSMAEQYPSHTFIIYGGSYDFNLWLKGLNLNGQTLRRIYSGAFTVVGGYRIQWRRGKTFYLCRLADGVKVTVYDVISFFQTTFVKACDSYLGDRFQDRARIVENKAKRGKFTIDELASITEYNNSELDNLIVLMDELRDRLNRVDLYPRRWDGPGAVAAYLLQREGVKHAMAECPDEVRAAARYAYAGGRFEVIKFGHTSEPCYEYDVNSAYPTAMQYLPDLSSGTWVHWDTEALVNMNLSAFMSARFALFRIEWWGCDPTVPGPLFRRLRDGSVHYPIHGEGWYWTPEFQVAVEYSQKQGNGMRVTEIWEYVSESDAQPFSFIGELYKQRKALKAIGDGGHVGIKLALNSLYGKECQQVGARQLPNGEWKKPPFHQLEWAGYVTSWCRARVLHAALQNLDAIIAFETDALFSSQPLDLDTGDNLGQFEELRFDNLTYMQSGIYYAETDGKPVATKTRGIDRGNLTRDECLALMDEPIADNRRVEVSLNRFQTLGVALMQGIHKWCQWLPVTKNVRIEPTGKRIHSPHCVRACDAQNGLVKEHWHKTICPTLEYTMSYAYPVIWENPQPEMKAIPDLSDTRNDWGDLDMYALGE